MIKTISFAVIHFSIATIVAYILTGDILVTGGISTNGIGTAVSLNVVGNDLVITVGSLSTTLTLG